ncbi:MAG: hypothetical protein ACYC2I_05880 [Elusimicrobiales bacterium]
MHKCKTVLLAVSAVAFFSAGAFAAEGPLLALNDAPARDTAIKVSALLQPATAQAQAEAPGITDFDALSAVGDPLFREGARELLKEAVRQDELKAQEGKAAKPVFRDAPADVPVKAVPARPVISRPRAKTPVQADPLQVKDTL